MGPMELRCLVAALLIVACGEDDPATGIVAAPESGEGEVEPGPGEGEGERPGSPVGEGEEAMDVPPHAAVGEGEGEPEQELIRNLCGEQSGDLPAGGVYTVTCPVRVPAGETLAVGPGSELDLGTSPFAVDGVLTGGSLQVTAALQAGFVVGAGGRIELDGGSVAVAEIEAGAPVFDVDGGALVLRSVRMVEGEERREAVRARPGATVTLEGVRMESFWIGVAVEDGAQAAIRGGTFVNCLTGVHAIGGARPTVSDSAFEGPGFHLRVGPGVFSAEGEPLLSGNTFAAGIPITLAGQVVATTELAPVDGVSRFEVLDLTVADGALLRIADGVEIAMLGASIEVAGDVAVGAVRFPGLVAPALKFVGGGGSVRGATFAAGAAAGTALVEVVAGAPTLDDVTFEDDAGASICLKLSGAEAAPVVTGGHLGCWLGVSVDQGAAAVSSATFGGHDTGVRLESSGTSLADLAFAGDGVHISVGPSWFAGGDAADLGLAGHDFGVAGEPFIVDGVLRVNAALSHLVQGEPLLLGAVSVRPGVTLGTTPGLELRQGGRAITVDGRAEFDQVLFSRLEGPAIHWRQEATGHIRDSRLEYVGAGAFPGLRVTDASPAIDDNELAGGAGGGVGVEVLGTEDVDVVAAPSIARNAFEGLRIGIHVVGDAEPVLSDNTFDDVADEVIDSELGGQ